MEATFVVVGGGIAGVTCAETLAFFLPEESIILLSESSLIKTVTNLHAITQTLSDFSVVETTGDTLSAKFPNIKVIHDQLILINSEEQWVKTAKGNIIKYIFLSICTGAKPKLIPQAVKNPCILGIRDVDSVDNFLKELKKAKKIVIVGNGGIASELVYKMENTEVHWLIKDKHMSATFIDPGAAEFLKHSLRDKTNKLSHLQGGPSRRLRYEQDPGVRRAGAALGPDWYKDLDIKGALVDCLPEAVKIHYETEVADVRAVDTGSIGFPVEVVFSNGESLFCDFIVSATGVEANFDCVIDKPLQKSADGCIIVDELMRSSISKIYAAGDVCHGGWIHAEQWFPMKLWTQARQMGAQAAKTMTGDFQKEPVLQDFCFELFAHTTQLFGYKLVLLGLFNGQKLDNNYEILFRMTRGVEYIKLVLRDDRLQGAVLIGDTDIEEMCENLILNKIDLSQFKEDLLDPDLDIEDYFD